MGSRVVLPEAQLSSDSHTWKTEFNRLPITVIVINFFCQLDTDILRNMKVLVFVCLLSATASGSLLGGLDEEHHDHHDHHEHHDFPLATGRETAEASVRLLEFFNAVEYDDVQFPSDMPTYNALPTDYRFTCADKIPGYYADVDYSCQVYHMCRDHPEHGVATFLCPNATVFHQKIFACDWWFNVDCASSPSFYYLNEDIYKDPEEEEITNENTGGRQQFQSFSQFDARPVRSATVALDSLQEFIIVIPEGAAESKGLNSISKGYVPPVDGYLPPTEGYLPPKQDYLPPTEGYLPPKKDYLPPTEGYLPPKKDYLPPTEGYLPPKTG